MRGVQGLQGMCKHTLTNRSPSYDHGRCPDAAGWPGTGPSSRGGAITTPRRRGAVRNRAAVAPMSLQIGTEAYHLIAKEHTVATVSFGTNLTQEVATMAPPERRAIAIPMVASRWPKCGGSGSLA